MAEAPPRPITVFEQLRDAMGWTQTQLGEFLGVAELTIWRWEHGQTAPPKLHARVAWRIMESRDPGALVRLLGPKGEA